MKIKKQFYIAGIISILFLALLIACATPAYSSQPTPTSMIEVERESTLEECPPVTPIPPLIDQPGKLIYALIDKSGSYREYTQSAIDMLVKSLILVLEPGDKLYVAWLGKTERPTDYLISGEVPSVENPFLHSAIPEIPTLPLSTITPLPTREETPNPNLSILAQQAATNTAQAYYENMTSTAVVANIHTTNTAIAYEEKVNEQRCRQIEVNGDNQEIINEWERQKKEVIDAFIAQSLLPLLTPTVEKFDSGTHIFNNLYIASKIIQTEREKEPLSQYYLLIFSDMEDVGSRNGEDLNINLQGIHVMVAMMYCEESILCQERSQYWENFFVEKGATLPFNPFRIIQESTPELIADFLNVEKEKK